MATDRACSARNYWPQFALILLVFFIHGGAPVPHVNEAHYLTKAKHYWEPAWCEGDFFLESADAHLVFYWTIGWLAKFFSLPTVAWIGRLVAWTWLAWAWLRLWRCFTDHWLSPVLGATLFVWLTSAHNFSGEWVVGGVEGKCFAYAGVLTGMAAMAQGKWKQVWPWFGLACAFHVLVGGWAALAAAGVWLVERRDQRTSLVSMIPSLALAIVLALPGIVPALALTLGVPAEVVRDANQIYVFDRLPHHLAPWTLEAETLMALAARFSVPLLAFVLLWRLAVVRERGETVEAPPEIALERVCRFAAWSLMFSLAGMIWGLVCYGHPALAASLLKYYWFRLADVAVPLAAAALVCYWLERLFGERSPRAATALTVAVALACWHLAGVTTSRWLDPSPPADKNLASPGAWRETCAWVEANTPEHALFLVPRSAQTFTWYSGRKSLATWKDMPQDARGIVVWSRRSHDVFWHHDLFGEYVPYGSLGELGAERILELADRYDLDFVVADEYPPLPLRMVYSNGAYTVYAVSPETLDSLESMP